MISLINSVICIIFGNAWEFKCYAFSFQIYGLLYYITSYKPHLFCLRATPSCAQGLLLVWYLGRFLVVIGAPRAKDQTLVSSMQHKCLAIELFLPALQHFIIRKQLHICLCLSLQRELVLREIEMSNTFFFYFGREPHLDDQGESLFKRQITSYHGTKISEIKLPS